MDLKLQGRVVAITGGASGIGRSCALRYLEEGCRVAVCGRNRANWRCSGAIAVRPGTRCCA